MNKINKFITYFKEDKKRLILLFAAFVGIILIFVPSFGSEKETKDDLTLYEYKAELEKELSDLCSSVKGAGKCIVRVTFAEGESFEYKGSNITASYPPKVAGVAVICEGAERDSVKTEITKCMVSLFGIGSNRVSVLKMK